MLRFFIFFSALTVFSTGVYAQQCTATVVSNNGYQVNIRIAPVAIIPSSNNCPWGYNYNVSLNYTVTITGNAPNGGLSTLQGNLVCNGNQSLFYDLPNGAATGNYVTGSNPYIQNDNNTAYLYTTHPSCTAATYNNLGCGNITIQINGPGIPNQTINCNSSGPLPIELSSFTGQYINKGAVLKWVTQTEKNNDFFTIEKSLEGSKWESVGEQKGAGNSLTRLSYSFTDNKVEQGVSYYRLKQTDFDGNYSYSPVINVLNQSGNIVLGKFWPNPFSHDFSFELMSPTEGRATYNILNDFGSIIKSGTIGYYSGKNEITLSSEEYSSGLNILEIVFDENHKIYKKIVKL